MATAAAMPRGGSFSAQLPHHLMLDMEHGTLLLSTPRRFSRSLALGCAWQIEPRNVEVCDESVILGMAKHHESLLRGLPIGSAVQCLMTIYPADTMPAWEALRRDVQEDGIVAAKQASFRTGLPHLIGQKRACLRRIETLLMFRLPIHAMKGTGVALLRLLTDGPLYAGARAAQHVTTTLQQDSEHFAGLRLGIEDALRAAGHRILAMNGTMLGATVARSLNPWMEEAPRFNEEIPLGEQVATEPLENTGTGWVMPTRQPVLGVHVLSLRRSAKQTYPGILSAPRVPKEGHLKEPLALWDAWPEPVTLAVNIAITDPQKMQSELEWQQKFAFLQGGNLFGDKATGNAALKKELDEVLEGLFYSGSHLLWGRIHLVLWGKETDLRRGSHDVIRTARQVDLEFCQEPDLGDTFFKQAMPLGFDPAYPAKRVLQRERRLPIPLLVNILPLYAGFRGTTTARLAYLNQRSEPVGFDPFDSPTNANMLITGTSGAGKSYTLIDLLQQELPLGAWAVLLDRLPSYEGLCAAHQGRYMALGFENPPCFNPFYGRLNDEHKAFLCACFAEMASGGTEPLGRAAFGVLSKAIAFAAKTWLAQHPPVVPGGYPSDELWMSRGFMELFFREDFVKQHSPDAEIGHDIVRRLEPYYGDGQYAKFFDGPNTFSLDQRLTVIELSHLQDSSDLQSAILFALIHLMTEFFNAPERRHHRKYFICDETIFLLKHKATADNLDKVMRTYRKLNTSAIFASQKASDFDTVVGAAIASIPEYRLFLQQRGDELQKMKKLFELSDAEMQLLPLAQKHHGWSSAYLKIGDAEGGLIRLVPDRWTKWMASQDRDEAQMRARYLAQAGGNLRQAVDALVRDYPEGNEGGRHA